MGRFAIVYVSFLNVACAAGFTFVLASPVASQQYQFKSAAFVFRTDGCDAVPQISATAEGLVNGERKSHELKVNQTAKPGVYAVFQSWAPEGQWVVNLKGVCGNATAGAIVPVGLKGFNRESSKILSHKATDSEIEEVLKTVPAGGRK